MMRIYIILITVTLVILTTLCSLATAAELVFTRTEMPPVSEISNRWIQWIPDTKSKEEALLKAIYLAEGGVSASKPYGILSVPCETKEECRQICLNTIRNNFKRYKKFGYKTHNSYLEFLQSRYAPIGAENDPYDLNSNWLRNVKYFLR